MASGIDLKMNVSGANKVQRELKQTGKAARGMGAGVSKAGAAMGGMAAAINPVTAGLAIAAAGFVAVAVAAKVTKDAFVGTIKATIELADELDEIGKKAKSIGGVSGEGLQVVIGAMELAGVESAATMKSLQKLNQSMGEGLRGTKSYTDAFDQLGISAEEMASLPLEERLLAFSAGLEKMGTRAEQAQVGALLMGRAFKDMVVGLDDRDALQGLMEDIQGFGVASNEAIQDSEDLKDAILRLEKAAFGLKSEALAPLIDVLTGVAQGTAEYLASLDAEEVKKFAHEVRNTMTVAVLAFAHFGMMAEKALLAALPVMDTFQAALAASMGNLSGAASNAGEALVGALDLGDSMDKAEARWRKFSLAMIDPVFGPMLGPEEPMLGPAPPPGSGKPTGRTGRTRRTGATGARAPAKVTDPLAGLKRELDAITKQLKSKEQLMAESLVRQLEATHEGVEAELITREHGLAQDAALIAAHDAKLLEMAQVQADALDAIAEEAAARAAERRAADVEAATAAIGAGGTFAGEISGLITHLADEQNEEAKEAAKVFFGIQQAAALAVSIIKMAEAIAVANALPAPGNIPAMVAAGAAGAAQIATITAATIKGVAHAGLPPGALGPGPNEATIMMRRDEMILDPVGTRAISQMLNQRTGGGQPIQVSTVLELDGDVLGRTVDNHLVRSSERGISYQDRIRY